MAFDKSGWAVDGAHYNENLPRVHRYLTADAQADVNTEGYFNGVYNEVSAGDQIVARVDKDGTPATVTFIVASKADGVVDVTDGTVASVADAD